MICAGVEGRGPHWRSRVWIALLPSVLGVLGCDLGGPRPAATEGTSAAAVPAASPSRVPAQGAAGSAAAAVPAAARCVQPLAVPAPTVAAPASRCPADPDGPLRLPTGQVQFTEAPSAPKVTVELALDDPARARGLMYRTQMDGDHGMLFSWDADARRSFWMQNTCIPLDLLFIAGDGTVVGILEQVPTLNTLPREVPCPARHVLELNAGWARSHGVQPGQHVDLET
ncbi:MAG: DUF192 domain-containing protein [Deltaproteobacteria bacterium]